MNCDLWRLSAIEAINLMSGGEISASELVEANLSRLDEVNGHLNAVTRPLHETARATAKAIDVARLRGEPLGCLAGLPVTIKDNVDVKGQATPDGVPAFKDLIAEENSPVVDNLLDAGAVPIGRTNTPEFSLRWHSDNPLFGAAINPWDKTRTPGGSTGGGAAALAAGVGHIAQGSDLGGSLRYPAYCNGVATIRPTLGRVPAFRGTLAAERSLMTQMMSVQGVIARTVADVRLALEVVSKRDARDPLWVPTPLNGPRPTGPLCVALVRQPAGDTVDPAVSAALDAATKALTVAGYEIEEVDPPEVARCAEVWGGLLMAEMRAIGAKPLREHGSEQINRSLDLMMAAFPEVDIEGFMRLQSERNRLLREWIVFLETYPLVLGPVSNIPPFLAGEDAGEEERVFEIYQAQRLMVAINLLGLPSAAVATGVVDGVPTGVQIIGSPHREDLCLEAASAIESLCGILTPIDPVTG